MATTSNVAPEMMNRARDTSQAPAHEEEWAAGARDAFRAPGNINIYILDNTTHLHPLLLANAMRVFFFVAAIPYGTVHTTPATMYPNY
jgi:hypothetical protein